MDANTYYVVGNKEKTDFLDFSEVRYYLSDLINCYRFMTYEDAKIAMNKQLEYNYFPELSEIFKIKICLKLVLDK